MQTLIVRERMVAAGVRCPHCGWLGPEEVEQCPADGTRVERLDDVIEPAVELAISQSAHIVVPRHFDDLERFDGRDRPRSDAGGQRSDISRTARAARCWKDGSGRDGELGRLPRRGETPGELLAERVDRAPGPASSESRSRSVTVPSSSDWWSIVTANGVPISSWRR